MSNSEYIDSEEIQSMARRQVVGSLVAAVVIAVAFGLAALRPAYRVAAHAAPHRIAVIQPPSFVMPHMAMAQSGVAVP